MNAIFNENYQLIFNEVQQPVEESFEKILLDIIQPVFDKYPYKELFAEWNKWRSDDGIRRSRLITSAN